MKTIVLLKRVPDLVEDLQVDDSGKALDEDCITLKLNEFDDHALEEALLLKESAGGEVTVMALDGEDTDKMLFTALAKGADRAITITGVEPGDNNLGLAKVFTQVLSDIPHDLILTGVQAADDRDGQLGPMVAALADKPFVGVVTGVEAQGSGVTLKKEYAGGTLATFEADLPLVLGIQAARQAPRYAPVSKVRQIQQSATIEKIGGSEGDGAGPSLVLMTPPEAGEGAQMLESAEEIMEILVAKGVI